MYKLTYKQFYLIRKEINGWVFWRESKPHIIVYQAQPNPYITYLLENL